MKLFLLELVPMFFRTRWPLKKYYWQVEELDAARQKAEEFSRIKWE